MEYKLTTYPDGQVSAEVYNHDNDDGLVIAERINSYQDIFKVLAIADAARSFKRDIAISLMIPCMFGQRSDRRFRQHNQSLDLKLICDVINLGKFDQVTVFDPHSDVTLALLNNSVKVNSFHFVKTAVISENSGIVLVSPDAGAYKKVFEYAQELDLEAVAAVKHRDGQGNIDLKFIGDVVGKPCLIVDDLLDGGWTFVKLAEQLKKQGASYVALYISHAYFNQGTGELRKHIDHIYCTNSVKDIPPDSLITQYRYV